MSDGVTELLGAPGSCGAATRMRRSARVSGATVSMRTVEAGLAALHL